MCSVLQTYTGTIVGINLSIVVGIDINIGIGNFSAICFESNFSIAILLLIITTSIQLKMPVLYFIRMPLT